MPKKVHGRSAPKSRTRPRNPQPRALETPTQRAMSQEELVPAVAAAVAAPHPSSNRPTTSSAAVRRPTPGRRAATLSTNYEYLHGDIRMLSMLAPAMVVLLVAAFFVFH